MIKSRIKQVGCSLIALVMSCNSFDDMKIDSFRTGVIVREVNAKYGLFKIKENMPMVRFQMNKKLDDHLDVYGRFDVTRGKFRTSQYFIDGSASGYFESFGLGINYYPLDSRNFSFDFGGEVFHSKVDLSGKLGSIIKIPDEIWGFGLNFGVSGRLPLSENISIIGSVGYNFTDNNSKNVGFDFDGGYLFGGIEIGLPFE